MKMKITKIMLVALTFFSLTSNAQEQEQYDCSFYYREALFYLKGDEYTKKDPEKAIEYLKPCARKGFDKAQLLLGRLYSFENTEEADKKAFDLIKKAAEQKNAIAMADLGIMFKYGRGCKLNFNKARKWFKKSAKLGNDKAAYSLGYLYLKGLGNVTQNYEEATKWFKKSNYSMAKYWLGVCYYKGYGVAKNIQKANKLLETNFKTTSTLPVALVKENDLEVGNIKDVSIINEEDNNSILAISEENLIGKWKGKLVQLDWSESAIEDKNDIYLEVKLDAVSDELFAVINYKGEVVEDKIIKLDNSIYFDNTFIELSHESFNNEIPKSLSHQLLSGDLQLKTLKNTPYLTIKINSYVNEWNEKGAPISLVLTKEVGGENSKEELSDEALKALSEQEDSFIKLYPNPFERDLIISYKLNNVARTKVQVNDLYGNVISIIENEKVKEKGEYRYFFNGSELKKGVYVVNVVVNNKNNTRVIIKK
ncbi:T9SS type A sorting domain-containing protein [Tenacibaculum ovolyticum]|uniref:T9SS type A sorting domain-containing protein n=1 Tax=Tenacibaculum ovolyticum TaxID=104270 RepID=UPI0007ECDE3F|nr:T9SS type A sorting domain-containing protein [Tenacibaculum ovolyticum]